jgi:hypothetical protein
MAERELTTHDRAAAADRRENPETRPEPDVVDVDGGHEDLSHSSAATQGATSERDRQQPLLPPDQSERFTTGWHEIQASFVDEPQQAVEQADALVAALMQRLAAIFSEEREQLEAQWAKGDAVSTEDLRVALTRYRSFFDRLLSA